MFPLLCCSCCWDVMLFVDALFPVKGTWSVQDVKAVGAIFGRMLPIVLKCRYSTDHICRSQELVNMHEECILTLFTNLCKNV